MHQHAYVKLAFYCERELKPVRNLLLLALPLLYLRHPVVATDDLLTSSGERIVSSSHHPESLAGCRGAPGGLLRRPGRRETQHADIFGGAALINNEHR